MRQLASMPPAAGWHSGGSGWLRYVPTVETGWGWSGAIGRAADTAVRLGSWTDTEILVCGSPEMTRDTVAILIRAGVQPAQILTESYDHSLYPPLAEADAVAPRDFSGTGAR